MSEPPNYLFAALQYAEQMQLPVFPCWPTINKNPLTANGFKDASRDPKQITEWWTKNPQAAIAMPTGIVSGIDVLDLDVDSNKKKNGLLEIRNWQQLSRIIASTPRGGRHLWFRSTGIIRNTTDMLAHGVDTRGEGGYVLLPPSRIIGVGSYQFETCGPQELASLTEFPADLRQFMEAIQRSSEEVSKPDEDAEADPRLVALALEVIPNDGLGWEDWNRIGMATFRATRGSTEGLVAFHAFSKKSAKYDARKTEKQWRGYHRSPPTRIGAGTLLYLANKHGGADWDRPFHDALNAAVQEPALTTPAPAQSPGPAPSATPTTAPSRGSIIIRASDVVIRPKQWLWPGHLVRGAQELLSGDPGLAKSQAQISLIACTTAGLPWPDGAKATAPCNVILLTAEDTLDQDVVPRLIAAKAVLERVHIVKAIRKDAKTQRQFLLGEDLEQLEKDVLQIGEVGLVCIDPITAYMGGKIDSHKATEVRSQLGPLKDFAERLDICVSTITHPAKSPGRKAIDHFIGSQSFVAAGRIAHLCVEEFEEEDDDGSSGGKIPTGRILFCNPKNNAGPKMPTLAYRIEGGIVVGEDPTTGQIIDAPRVIWDGPVDITADAAIAAAAGSDGVSKRDIARPRFERSWRRC